jgi:hypothetical protein
VSRPRILIAIALVCALAGVVAAVAAAAGNYGGAARDIALTAGQAKYKALTGSGAAAKPTADKRRGYRSGWQVAYLKGTPAKPIAAFALIYVYKTKADAQRAYAASCKACSGTYRVEGVSMKFMPTTQNSTPGVINIATCRNVYVAIVVSGKIGSNALAQAAGALAGGVYAKARAGGMSPCKTG